MAPVTVATLLESGLVLSGSGSVNTETLSRNHAGLYVRSRTSPTDPASAYQLGRRTQISFIYDRWKTLTPEKREGWNRLAKQWPRRNALGQVYYTSGWNAFTAVNFPRHMAALPRVETAPTIHRTSQLSPVAADIYEGFPRVTILFDEADDWVTESNGALLVFASPTVSPSVNWYRGPYRFVGKIRGNPTTPPTSPYALGGGFGRLNPDDHWFGRVYCVRQDGRLSARQYLGPYVVTPV